MPKSLVTGGAGFIGSHLADKLLDMEHKVVILDDLSGGFLRNVPDGAEFVEGSINDKELVDKLFEEEKFDYVYHMAAYAAEGLSHFIRRFNYENNLIGSINLINNSVKHNIKHFIFGSSIAVYGTNQLPMTEDMTPEPEDPYGISKYAIELDLKAARKMFRLNYTIFRMHNVYGPRQHHGDTFRNVIGIFMNKIMLGEPLTIFGDGNQTRAFTYIDDISGTIASTPTIVGAKNETFNAGSDMVHSVKEVANYVIDSMGDYHGTSFLEKRNEVLHAFSDHKKIKEVFDTGEDTTLKEGIEKTAVAVKKIGALEPSTFESVEISKKLPESWHDKIQTL